MKRCPWPILSSVVLLFSLQTFGIQSNRALPLARISAAGMFAPPQSGPRDLYKEAKIKAEKESLQKNHAELKDATAELAKLSQELSDEVAEGDEHVISARVFARLDKIEKLIKNIRDKAKGP